MRKVIIIPDEQYAQLITAFCTHFKYRVGQMVPNPDYEPETIANPLYDIGIPQYIDNPEYNPENPESLQQILNPEYQPPTIPNPPYNPEIPISIELTREDFAWGKLKDMALGVVSAYLTEQAEAQAKAATPTVDFTITAETEEG